jgi:hypothetical protein
MALGALTALPSACGDPTASGRNQDGSGGNSGIDPGTGGTTGSSDGGVDIDPELDGGEPVFDGYRSDKVDLLFVIDNSLSMADKQEILAQTVPDLIARMARPDCIDQAGTRSSSGEDAKCPSGSELEFKPVTDIHIGVISSSLGGYGSKHFCAQTAGDYNVTQVDMARLLTRKKGGGDVPTYKDLGFLAWDPGNLYGGDGDLAHIQGSFRDLVLGVGEQGCGFEAPLEAVYRFLIDPDPYESIQIGTEGTPPAAVLTGTDQVLLEQRKSFLRPDSLLAIFTITDENDCSLIPGGQYYAAFQNNPLFRATSQCDADPNDACCQSCAQVTPNAGCPSPAEDAECKKTGGLYDSELFDPLNLRCFNQKRRFGIDMLFPPERYIAGVENRRIVDRHGQVVDNPIYSDLQCGGKDCKPPRPRSFVFWVGIVGVPWQDVALDPTDLGKGLMSAEEMHAQDRWSVILGNPTASPPVPPTDPLMIESVSPRSGTHPFLLDGSGAPLTTAAPDAPQGQNLVNGHEYNPYGSADLQYACTFALPTPRDCSAAGPDDACDCVTPDQSLTTLEQTKNPLCQAEGSTEVTTIQHYAKAYPGLRVLQVLKGIDPAQSIVASICPSNLTDDSRPDFGYRPVVPPLMDKLKKQLIPR